MFRREGPYSAPSSSGATKLNRRQFLGLTGLLGTGFVLGPHPALADDDLSGTLNYDAVRARGVLRVPYYEDFAPYSATTRDGPAGIDIEIAREVAARIGLKARFFPLMAGEKVDDDLRNGVWRGNLVDRSVGDLMLHVPYDRQVQLNNDLVVLFAPYLQESFAIACNPQVIPDSFDPEIDADKRIGVEIDTVPDFYLASAHGGALRQAIVHFIKPLDAVAALRDSAVDAVILQRGQLEAFIPRMAPQARVKPFVMGGMFRSRWTIGCAVRETCRPLVYEVGDALTAMAKEGRLEAIFAAAGVTYQAPGR